MEPGRRLSGLAATALACVLVAGGVAGWRLIAERRIDHERAGLSERLASAAVELNRGLGLPLRILEAEVLGTDDERLDLNATRVAAGDAIVALALVGPDGQLAAPEVRTSGATAPGVATLVRDDALQAALSNATDRAAPQLAVVDGPRGATTVGVVPRYEPARPMASTAARRGALQGHLVAILDVRGLARTTVAEALHSGDSVRVLADDIRVFEAGTTPSDGADVTIPLSLPGGGWVIAADVGESGGAAVAAAVGGALLALVVLVLADRDRRRSERAQAALRARDEAGALIGDVGAILQRSLDLADVLPALATALTDHLDLGGITVLVADDEGSLVSSFSSGAAGDDLPRRAGDIPRLPREVTEGTSVVVPLDRGGRAVGAVWLAPRRGLTASQLAAVRVVAELMGSAIVNARTLQREQATARRLLEVDQLKNDFLGTVSHELRTPVTAIDGFGSLLEKRWDSIDEDQRRELVSRIARNARSLSAMLEGLLDFARLERRSMQLQRVEVDLSGLVRSVIEQTSSLLDDRQLVLDAAPGVWVRSDPQGVERILSNLLTNSAKFSPPHTTITVGVEPRGGRAVLTVTDEGPGVPRGERVRIFSRFYRGSGDAALRTRGAGVGLAVVKELVDRLDATVAVTDGPGGGARFVVSFPAVVPATSGAAG